MSTLPHDDRAHWMLDEDVRYLTHGTFGACPRPVLAAQQALRESLERDAVDFMVRRLEGRLDAARAALAGFVGADPADLVFVNNATEGVNAVVRSLTLQPDDELLVTDHGYNAASNAARFAAEAHGARVRCVPVPFPLADPDEVVECVLAAVGPRTRLAVVDHVTSPTGLVLPVERLARELAERGVDVLVDGAHAPGMLPLDIRSLDVPYYTGNCHKWLCAPKGAGFLVVRADRQASVRPPVISHGANSSRTDRSRFHLEFDWTGTDDPTAWLCVPTALDFMGGLRPGGWPELMAENRAKALAARATLCDALEINAPAPPEMIGALASVPLPDARHGRTISPLASDPLQDALWAEHRVEVPVICWPAPPARLLRVSAQVYNRAEEYEHLAQVLPGMLAREGAELPGPAR